MATTSPANPTHPPGSELTATSILTLLNSVRTTPKYFLSAVEKRLESYKDNKYRDSANQKFKSSEGPTACKELHQLLEKQGALPPLVHDAVLSSIAQTHCDHISSEGVVSHIGGSGLEIAKRLDEKGEWSGRYNECIAVQTTTPTDLILKWLIDDGIQTRGDRNALLIEKPSKIGIGVNLHHKTHQVCIVAILVEHFGQKGSPDLPKPVENANITNELPEDIKALPEDALSMNIFRRTISENGVKKITYNLKYEMKDGTSKEVIKVYSQHNDGALVPVIHGENQVKKAAPVAANNVEKEPFKEPIKPPTSDANLPPPLPFIPAAPQPPTNADAPPKNTQPPVPPTSGTPPPPPTGTIPPAPAPGASGVPPPPQANPPAPPTTLPPAQPTTATPPPHPSSGVPPPPPHTAPVVTPTPASIPAPPTADAGAHTTTKPTDGASLEPKPSDAKPPTTMPPVPPAGVPPPPHAAAIPPPPPLPAPKVPDHTDEF